jgi:hypothetical protein
MRQPDILDRCLMIVARLCPYLVGAVLLLALAGMLSAQEYYSVRRGGERRVEGGGSGGETNIPQFARSITWYRFNEFTNSAGKHVDSSAVGTNTAVPAAGGAMPTWISANQGIYFHGGAYSVQDCDYILNGLTAVTYSVWFSNSVWTVYDGIFMTDNTSINGIALEATVDNLAIYYATNTAKQAIDTYANGTAWTNAGWTHVAITISTNDFTFVWYINGILVRTDVDTKLKENGFQSSLFYIGRQGSIATRFFYGNIDDPLIYSINLTSNEVWQLYQFGH